MAATQIQKMRRKLKDKLYDRKILCLILINVLFIVAVCIYGFYGTAFFRLDQYMSAICTTTATLTVTMFGLTAASYAFVCSELRTEEQSRPHLKHILVEYRNDLWCQFVYSLVFTAETTATSLICLGLAQKVSAPDLYTLSKQADGAFLAAYENSSFHWLSSLTVLNFLFATTAIAVMVFHNVMIFRRENQYSLLAKSLLEKTIKPYECPGALVSKQDKINQDELEKIHNLERLLNRILRNHESVGESFAAENRLSRLLELVLSQKLKQGFRADEELTENDILQDKIDIPPGMARSGIASEKQKWYCCYKQAHNDYQLITMPKPAQGPSLEPSEYSFVQVYNDLLCYRDSKLVLSANIRDRLIGKSGSHLRCSAKKRIMLFLLWSENFSNMDLTGINFSGADLHHTNFSDSDLSRVRLIGANCEGADFSHARLPGLYFCDVKRQDNDKLRLCQGQIPVSCIDDSENRWDPYNGKEATCFRAAAFSGADVSRAFLAAKVTGELWKKSFPYCGRGERVESSYLYSLEDTCFDHAKLFSSRFRDLSFDHASLERAQIFDSVFFRCSAQSSNFSQAVLTRSLLFCCDFYGASLEGAILAQCVVLRGRFEDARLKNATFAEANLVCCNFRGAYCQNVSFRGVIQNLKKIEELSTVKDPFMAGSTKIEGQPDKFTRLDFSYSVLSNTDFTEMDLSRACFKYAVGFGCIFTGARGECVCMDAALLTSSIFNQTHFQSSSFCRTLIGSSVFMEATFKNCTFLDTDFSHALFQSPCKAVFSGGSMENVNFRGAEGLSEEHFDNIRLVNCDFTETGLTPRDFRRKHIRIINCRF